MPMHHDNWGNCYEDPSYLEYIVGRKAKEKGLDLGTAILLPGARYIHRDDMNIERYLYPDWRDRMNWKRNVEYGPDGNK
jgi:hypothetical protein